LALTSPTGGGRSVGIVRLRTKATEFSFFFSTKLFTEYTVILCSSVLHTQVHLILFAQLILLTP